MDEDRLSSIQEELGYTFGDISLLQNALVHPSLCRAEGMHTFERLEFLGDRVLGLVVAQWIYTVYPEEAEGKLARRYGVLVGRQTLKQVAKDIHLEKYLLFDQEIAQKRHEETVLADGCEALIGAIFLDGGLSEGRRFIQHFWASFIDIHALPPTDPKSALQEWAQKEGKSIPSYVIQSIKGPDHSPEFKVVVQVEGLCAFTGKGFSKRDAEKEAAQKVLDFLFKEKRM